MLFTFPIFRPRNPRKLAFHAGESGTGATVVGPATIQKGDLLVFQDFVANGTTTIPTSAYPSGFTPINSVAAVYNATNGYRGNLSAKIATGAEASANIGGMTGTSYSKILGVFRPDVPAKNMTISSAVGSNGNGALGPLNMSYPSARPMIAIAAYRSAGGNLSGVSAPGHTGGILLAGNTQHLTYGIRNALTGSPADTAISLADAGEAQTLQGCMITLRDSIV